MSTISNKYHILIAEYYKDKHLYIDEPKKEKPNIRKLVELPYQQAEGEMPEVEETLCDLMFIEAKCRAKMAHQLLIDYQNIGVWRAEPGALILTVKFWEKEYGVECPYCLSWSRIEAGNLGRRIECKECGSHLKLNQFYIDAEWKICMSRKEVTKKRVKWHFDSNETLKHYSEFVHLQCHILALRPDLVLQMAANQPDSSPVARTAVEQLDIEGKEWLKWVNKLQNVSPVIMTFQGHSGGVTACTYSPDGSRILSASTDNTLNIWDSVTGVEIASLSGHSSVVNSCAYSPDGRRIVSGANDFTLRIWDADIGVEIITIEAHSSVVTTCAYSPDGRRIVSGSWDKSLKIWDTNTGMKVAILRGHSKWVTSCAYSPDGKRIVSGSEDNTLRIWDSETGKEIAKLEGHTDAITTCAYSPDGRSIISGSGNSLRTWDAEAGEQITKYAVQEHILTCSFSPDGKRIVLGLAGGALSVVDTETGEQIASHKCHSGKMSACAYSPDGKRIISGSSDKTIKIWDESVVVKNTSIEGHSDSVTCCTYSPDGRRVVSGSKDKTLKIWDTKTGKEIATLTGNKFDVIKCAYSPNGKRIFSECHNNTLNTWDAMTGEEIAKFKYAIRSHHEFINTPDGKIIVSPLKGETQLKIWDTITGKEISSSEEYYSFLAKYINSSDGRKFVSCVQTEGMKIGEVIATLKGFILNVKNCAYSSNGTRFISLSDDKTIKIWDYESGQEITSFPCDTRIECLSVNIGKEGFTVGCSNGSLLIFEIGALIRYISEPLVV